MVYIEVVKQTALTIAGGEEEGALALKKRAPQNGQGKGVILSPAAGLLQNPKSKGKLRSQIEVPLPEVAIKKNGLVPQFFLSQRKRK